MWRSFLLIPFGLLLWIGLLSSAGGGARPQKFDRNIAKHIGEMLRQAHEEVKRNYFDPAYKGVDWDARYEKYKAKMKEVTSLDQGYSLVAGLLDGLNDSHTFFVPPLKPIRIEKGFQYIVVGVKTFVLRVRPQTDAETKVHSGDEIITFNDFLLNRDSLWKMDYYYGMLAPQSALQLVLKDPKGQQREVKVEAKIQQQQHILDYEQGSDFWEMVHKQESDGHEIRQRHIEMGGVMIWKVPEFVMKDSEVDHLFSIARNNKALILDLRENPGGVQDTLTRMVGNVFQEDVKIADRDGRKELKPILAKGRRKDAFSGQVVVMVDSKSRSAAELFARVMQLEHRGTVVGDRTSGSVMEAMRVLENQGVGTRIFYGFQITEADLIMKDGKSLEHLGVNPDEIVLPTATDLADSKDPALVRAAALVGLNLDPTQAGKLFPYEWGHFDE